MSFFFNDTATTESSTYGHTLSLHDARPISTGLGTCFETRFTGSFPAWRRVATVHAAMPLAKLRRACWPRAWRWSRQRSEEHTSELQSLMRNSYAVFCLKKQQQESTRMPTRQYREKTVT